MKTLLPILCCALAFPMLEAQEKTAAPDDESVQEGIADALLDFEQTSDSPVTVSVNKGVATLTGQVDSLPVKRLAATTASTIRGVRAVINHLEVKEVAREDDTIAGDLSQLYALHHPGRDDSFTYKVNDGVVTLTGTVTSFAFRRLAEDMASTVTGVRSVVNALRVQLLEQPDDDEIRQHLALRIKSNPLLDDQFVKFSVDKGAVAVSGAVDSFEEKRLLLNAVEASGAHAVDSDKLTVSPGLRPEMERPHQPAFLTDEEIEMALRSAFRQDTRLDSSNIEIEVVDGDITLGGYVESIGARSEAERVAADLPGRGRVYSFLVVKSPDWADDSAVESALNLIYEVDSQLGASELTVKVENQTATLTGMTDSVYQRRRAVQLASSVPGVQRVINKLRVDWRDSKPENNNDSQ
ncbi:MAG: BON domain-containing protein [Verrucomicrobiales bacterium]|nr:BON domain-containing protein [Verrucomicrobiales bacterium]